MWGRQPPSLHLTRVPDVTLIRVKWEKFNCHNLTIFFYNFFYENWFFWTFTFLHFCKYFQFRTTYLSLQYLIFCIQMSGFYWIWICFDKSKTKPVIPQRTSPIFYDTHFMLRCSLLGLFFGSKCLLQGPALIPELSLALGAHFWVKRPWSRIF